MAIARIGYIINVFPKLSETFVAMEMAELRRRGIEVLVASLRAPTESLRHPIIESAGLLERTVYDKDKFLTALKEFRPDILHAHFATEPTAAAREFSRQLNVPFTFTAHGYDIHRKPPADFDERAADARAVVTVSHANADYIQKAFNIPREKLRIIPCGVDTDLFRPATAPSAADEPPLVVCVARHVVVKNLVLLLRALALVRDSGALFRGVLIGDGPCHDELKRTADELRLNDRVQFLGAATQDQVLPWLQRASVAVLSSSNEGMPVSLMEAAACGVPVVATAVGGIPELVRDGVTGFLTAPEAEPFAVALRRLLENRSLARTMGAAARADAVARFSVRHQADALLALWESCAWPK